MRVRLRRIARRVGAARPRPQQARQRDGITRDGGAAMLMFVISARLKRAPRNAAR